MHVTVAIKNLSAPDRTHEADFPVDAGAIYALVPGRELRRIGIQPVGNMVYELADGSLQEYAFVLAQITFMGEITAGRVIFGPDHAEPLLGVTALESVGIMIDPATQKLKRLPAVPLK